MALQDKIGREEIVDKICGLVGSLKKDKNFCLAINGAWGSGKSFVLGLIEEKLSKKQEYIIIKYDAWENTFYSDPLIAILSCVIDGIEEKLYLVERTEEKVKKAAKTGVNTLAKLSTKIEKLKAVIEGIKTIIKDFHNPIDTAALGDFKSYQKLLKATKEILNEITQAGEYREKQTKLVILVDEIDRCLPDEQLKILERLHHLFDVKNCAVIVTMNQICVAETVKTIYGIDGYEYLRKFFNFTFRLDTSANEYLKNLLEEYIKSFEKIQVPASDVGTPVKLAYQCLLYGSEKALDKADNRELTRYFECVTKDDSNGLQPEKFETYQILRPDELVFKLIDLQNVSTSRVGLSPYLGLVSPAYIILKSNKRVLPAFAEKYFLMLWKNQIFNALGDAGVRSNLNSKDLLELSIPLPPLDEQQEIADYLDNKCAEIEQIIADKKTQIETLDGYKKSLIYEYVTGKKEVV